MPLVRNHVDLVDHQQYRAIIRQQLEHFLIAFVITQCFQHVDHHLHIAQAAGDDTIHPTVQGIEVFGLESRRIDEHELRMLVGVDSMDAMTSGLGLARGDADLLPDQVVKQRGLADVGPSDDGDKAAAKWFRQAIRIADARKIR